MLCSTDLLEFDSFGELADRTHAKRRWTLLVDQTIGQWSDGFGNDAAQNWFDRYKVYIELYPFYDNAKDFKPNVQIVNLT